MPGAGTSTATCSSGQNRAGVTRSSRACQRFRPHAPAPVVLEFGTANLLGSHAGCVFWSRINTGSTMRGGARTRRDGDTLQPMASYRSGPVAELAVRGRVTTAGRRP